jgi:hypothetical protein
MHNYFQRGVLWLLKITDGMGETSASVRVMSVPHCHRLFELPIVPNLFPDRYVDLHASNPRKVILHSNGTECFFRGRTWLPCGCGRGGMIAVRMCFPNWSEGRSETWGLALPSRNQDGEFSLLRTQFLILNLTDSETCSCVGYRSYGIPWWVSSPIVFHLSPLPVRYYLLFIGQKISFNIYSLAFWEVIWMEIGLLSYA